MRSGFKHFVYFAKMADGLMKIGCSTNVEYRCATLKAEPIFVIEGSSFRENAVHFLLRKDHSHKEFFFPGDAVNSFIEAAKLGDYQGLISDLPRPDLWLQPDVKRAKRGTTRPFREIREALDISHEQIANEAGVMKSTAVGADSQTAPYWLSGRLSQYIITKARDAGLMLDSHHLSGVYDRELHGLLNRFNLRRAAA